MVLRVPQNNLFEKNNCSSKLPCGICRLTNQQCPYHIEQPSVVYTDLTCNTSKKGGAK